MIFQTLSEHNPARIALRDEAWAVPYGHMTREIEKRAASLKDVRVLALSLDNSVDWVLWDLAALRAGTPCVPLPPFFSPPLVRHALETAGVSHILLPNGLQETGLAPRNMPAGTAKVTYTSGSTGNPKGVCLSKTAMENVAQGVVEALGPEMAGTHLCTLPLAVLLENVAGVYAALMGGATVEIRAVASFGDRYGRLYEHLRETCATSVILVPEMLRMLMIQTASRGPLPAIRYAAVGGARTAPDMIKAARSAGLPVYEGYGLSECGSVVALNTPRHDKVGTVGRILPHITAGVEQNEIIIRSPGFLGYIGASAPEWFQTGDLGAIDADGFLKIDGRKKNILITSFGRNISPEWVESELVARPEIAQAFVFGDAQPFLSALIVPAGCSFQAIEKAIQAANLSLPDYAHICAYHIVPPFTIESGFLTGNGRLRRAAILDHYRTFTQKESDYEFLRQAC